MRAFHLLAAAAVVAGCATTSPYDDEVRNDKVLVAHRGASAYAPEHTRAAYELALAQGADYVEQDLGVTKDGVLVCLHDDSLERTTNVATVFPDRFTLDDAGTKRWMVYDFTLAEIKQLDAGAWFNPKFAGERVLTWEEAVDLVNGRAGLYPELKSPGLYRSRGLDSVALLAESLKRRGLDRPGAGRPPIIVQCFDADALQAFAKAAPDVPRVLLVGAEDAARTWLSEEGLARARTFAQGIGPAKAILLAEPDIVRRAQALGLTVTPYTFRSADTGSFSDVGAEMRHFLDTLGVDAVFTDNPDLFPRR
jgi:glycerophosphoryl diester phosphodiesterase